MRFANFPLGFRILGALLLIVPVAAEARAKFSWEDHQIIDQKWPEAVETSTGLRYIVAREGDGPHPKPGDKVSVLYKGMLIDGKVFDQKLDREEPFVFRHSRGEVIAAWEEAIGKMSAGEARLLIVPAALAYGSRGRPPNIPRNAALVFEVELLKIEPVE
jgi:FKBP-type peptidyl-prolyl cis-trans isomerase